MKNLFWAASLFVLISGCAGSPDLSKQSNSNDRLSRGDIAGALNQLESSNKNIKNKDLPYFLNKSTLLSLSDLSSKQPSIDSLMVADKVVDDWISQAEFNFKKSSNDFFNYLYPNSVKNTYQPKDYEKTMIGFNLSIIHYQEKKYDLARVGAMKIAERETSIIRINENKYNSIKEQEKNKNDNQIISSIDSIKGYPVEMLNSAEVNSLKNSYQNAGAHYLAGFIFEMHNEVGLAAPGYRQAIELNPSNRLFSESLSNLDDKIKKNNANKNTSEVLFVVESGDIPKLKTFKSNFTYRTINGGRLVTLRLPVLESSQRRLAQPSNLIVNFNNYLNLYQVANLDVMSKRQLKDDMPAFLLKSTTQAVTQIVAQEATQAAFQKNNKQKNDGMAEFAAILVGVALSVGEVDTRSWSMLPSHIHMGRIEVSKGKINVEVPVSNRTEKFELNITENYHIVRIRHLNDNVYVSY
jgi:hypothetical protein